MSRALAAYPPIDEQPLSRGRITALLHRAAAAPGLRLFSLAALCFLAAVLPVASQAQSQDVLPPQKAYPYRVEAQQDRLLLKFDAVKGYYLYRDRFGFASKTNGIELGTPELPQGQVHEDEFFGKQEVYRGAFEIAIPYTRVSGSLDKLTLEVRLQGCADYGICYPPQKWTRDVRLPAAPAGSASSGHGTSAPSSAAAQFGANSSSPVIDFSNGAAAASVAGPAPPVSAQSRFAAVALGGPWWVLLGLFYGAGLALAFTPCVLPLVPIISGIIAGQGELSTRRGFALSLSYVLGMAFTYTVAGGLAALAGQQVQAVFQKPWIISLFAGVFVLLALSMFGLYNLQMPSVIQTRVASLANRQRAGSFVGTGIMGVLSALIVTTCVAPALVAALAVIGQQGDVVRGAAALFALSIGMGSPLLLVGASAGALLPRTGGWMTTVKAAFGVMMLGLAIWMLQRVLPGTVALVLWAVLVFLTGVFLGAFDPLPVQPGTARRLSKGVGVLACLYGALMLVGATLGGESPWQPIPRGLLTASAESSGAAARGTALAAAPAASLGFRRVSSVDGLEQALGDARRAGQPVLVDFTADWCVSCKEMEKYTFPDPQVVAALQPFMLLRADVTANTAGDQALLKYFKSYGPPTIAFFDAHGGQQEAYKLVGFVPAKQFAAHVKQLASL
ncbi:MAG TPA: protein-disulfide reductase DsbD [Gammaproteobacteria bacterium]|nr:protein-disulfide reductase DsbD [Gammaproteobacteria bacterium]